MQSINSLSEDLKTKKYVLELAESFANSVSDLESHVKSLQIDLSPMTNLASSIERQRISAEAQKIDLQPIVNNLSASTNLLKSSVDKLDSSVDKLKILLSEEEKKKLQEDVLISYSETSLPKGSTHIDFREGTVTKSDKSVANITGDIQTYLSEYVRSIVIMTSTASSANLVGRKTSVVPLAAGKYTRILNHEISTIEITASAAFDLYLVASMEKDGCPMVN